MHELECRKRNASTDHQSLILQLADQFVDVRDSRVSLPSQLSRSDSRLSSSDTTFEQCDLIGVLLQHRYLRDLLRVESISKALARRDVPRRTALRSALVSIILARLANLSVLSVSVACSRSGETVQMMATREFPESAGCSNRVSFESR